MLDPKTMPSYVVFTRELSSNQPSKFHFLNSTLGLAVFQDQKKKIMCFYSVVYSGLDLGDPPGPLISSATAATSIRKNLAEEVGEC